MRHSLTELYDLIDLPDPQGFPLRALGASIAEAESAGDPLAFVAHDPPPKGAPSTGLFMVHQPAYPEIFAATEAVRTDPSLTDEEKIARMTDLARPILADMLSSAVTATRILQARGLPTNMLSTALFVDAAWQTGGSHLLAWAHSTATGNPSEIVNHSRTIAIEVALRDLAHEALGVAPGLAVAAAFIGGLIAAGTALAFWDP